VSDAAARVDTAAVWGVGEPLPAEPGRDTDAMLASAAAGHLALLVGGVEIGDLPDPAAALAALAGAPFVVSLEVRQSEVSEHADVVLPVAPVAEKSGTFVDWEGRSRAFDAVLKDTGAMSDARVLSMLAEGLGAPIGLGSTEAARRELAELDAWTGERVPRPATPAAGAAQPQAGEARLSSWRLLLDAGRMQDGEPYLAGTAHPAVARLSAATAAEVGVADGELLTVSTAAGSVTLPAAVDDLPDRVVWLPTHSAGCSVRSLAAHDGSVVRLSPGGAA
jgi:NADH-quinone oxidoreductase subunit G